MNAKDTLSFDERWAHLILKLDQLFGKKHKGINNILYLIGVQELGQGIRDFSKSEKQDIIHIGICKVLSLGGYYIFTSYDEEGWPHWELKKKLPKLDETKQEEFMKKFILEYFETEIKL